MKPSEADYLIGAGVIGAGIYDIWAMSTGHETISAAVRRHTERPWAKYMLVGFMGGLTLHFLLPPINLGGDHAPLEAD